MIQRLIAITLAVALLCGPSSVARGSQPAERQYWLGEMSTGAPANPTLSFLVTLWQEGGTWHGTLDVPPSIGIGGAWGVELLSVEVTPESIELVQPAGQPGAQPNLFIMTRTPKGAETAVGRLLIGGSAEVPARMWKVGVEDARDFMPRRPQAPQSPRPYVVRQVAVPNTRSGETVELAGILTVPTGPGPHPAVVLVNALDVHDVDHSSMGHKPFEVLADRLGRAGIATLRTPDRPLKRVGLAPRVQLTIEQLGTEAAERGVWLGKQEGIDAGRIGLLGLNEGGTAAAIAATQAGSTARCLVMLAPLATTGIEQLRGEFANAIRREGEKPEFAERRTASFIKAYELLAAGAPEAEVVSAIEAEMTMQRDARRQQLGEASPEIVSGLAKQQYLIMNTPEFRHDLVFDPTTVFARVPQPAMAILGGKDTRFDAGSTVPAVERSLGKRAGIETVIRVGAGLNHRLQPALGGGLEEVQEIELTFDESVLSDIVSFLQKQLNVTAATKEGNQ